MKPQPVKKTTNGGNGHSRTLDNQPKGKKTEYVPQPGDYNFAVTTEKLNGQSQQGTKQLAIRAMEIGVKLGVSPDKGAEAIVTAVDQLQADLAARPTYTSVTQLHADLVARGDKISELEGELSKVTTVYNDLLMLNHSQSEKVREFEAQLEQKDIEIQNLRAKASANDKAELNLELTNKLNAAVQERDDIEKRLQQANELSQQQDSCIARLKGEIVGLNDKIAKAEIETSRLVFTNEALNLAISRHNSQLDEKNQEIQSRTEQIKELSKILEEEKRAREAMQQVRDSYSVELGNLRLNQKRGGNLGNNESGFGGQTFTSANKSSQVFSEESNDQASQGTDLNSYLSPAGLLAFGNVEASGTSSQAKSSQAQSQMPESSNREDVIRLEQLLQVQNEQIRTSESRISELANQIGLLEQIRLDLVSQNEKLKEEIASLNTKLEKATLAMGPEKKKLAEGHAKELAGWKRKLEDAQKSHSAQVMIVNERTKTLRDREADIRDLNKKIEEINKIVATKDGEIAKAKRSFEEACKISQDKENEAKKLKRQLDEKEKESKPGQALAELTLKLDAAVKDAQEKAVEIGKMKVTLAEKEAALVALEAARVALVAQVAALEAEKVQLVGEVVQLVGEVKNLKAELLKITGELAAVRAQLAAAQAQIGVLNGQVATANAHGLADQTQIGVLTGQLAAANGQLAAAQSQEAKDRIAAEMMAPMFGVMGGIALGYMAFTTPVEGATLFLRQVALGTVVSGMDQMMMGYGMQIATMAAGLLGYAASSRVGPAVAVMVLKSINSVVAALFATPGLVLSLLKGMLMKAWEYRNPIMTLMILGIVAYYSEIFSPVRFEGNLYYDEILNMAGDGYDALLASVPSMPTSAEALEQLTSMLSTGYGYVPSAAEMKATLAIIHAHVAPVISAGSEAVSKMAIAGSEAVSNVAIAGSETVKNMVSAGLETYGNMSSVAEIYGNISAYVTARYTA